MKLKRRLWVLVIILASGYVFACLNSLRWLMQSADTQTTAHSTNKNDNGQRARVVTLLETFPYTGIFDEVTKRKQQSKRLIRVLCARTVGRREIDAVIHDFEQLSNVIMHNLSVLITETENKTKLETVSIDMHWLWFTFNETVYNVLQSAVTTHKKQQEQKQEREHSIDVDIVYSANTQKIYFWLTYVDEQRLREFDYVWFADGDVNMTSMNMSAFWSVVLTLKPLIAQPSIVGIPPTNRSSDHKVLRQWHSQAKTNIQVIATHTDVIELMVPLFQRDTWLHVRQRMMTVHTFQKWDYHMGIDCLWCQLALEPYIAAHRNSSSSDWNCNNSVGMSAHQCQFLKAPTYKWTHWSQLQVITDTATLHNNHDYDQQSPSPTLKHPFVKYDQTNAWKASHPLPLSCVVVHSTSAVHMNKESISKLSKLFRTSRAYTVTITKQAFAQYIWPVDKVYQVFLKNATSLDGL